MTRRRLRAFATLSVIFAARSGVLACPICFQVEQNATTDGLLAAVTVLVVVTSGVLIGFGLFVRRLARSEAASPEPASRGTSPAPDR
jgi:hypothetical protein